MSCLHFPSIPFFVCPSVCAMCFPCSVSINIVTIYHYLPFIIRSLLLIIYNIIVITSAVMPCHVSVLIPVCLHSIISLLSCLFFQCHQCCDFQFSNNVYYTMFTSYSQYSITRTLFSTFETHNLSIL